MKISTKRAIGTLAVVLASGSVMLTGCSSSGASHHESHRHSEIYSAEDRYYCRTYNADDGSFVWWLLVWDSQSQINRQNANVSLTGAKWQPASAPVSPVATGVAVSVDRSGRPDVDEETESDDDIESSGDDVTDEGTSAEEAAQEEQAAVDADNADSDAGSGGGDSDGGGSDSGGGDVGGGDAGGGGE